jgi:hypothetical protein
MKSIFFAAASLALVASPALAQTATGDTASTTVTLTASVEPLCAMSTADTTFHINTVPANAGSIIDSDGTLKAQTSVAEPLSAFAGGPANLTAWCNGVTTTVELEAKGMTNPNSTGGHADFVNYIDLSLTGWQVDGHAIPSVVTSAGSTVTSGAISTGGVFSGQFDGNIAFVDTGKKLVQGDYTGWFRLTLATQ